MVYCTVLYRNISLVGPGIGLQLVGDARFYSTACPEIALAVEDDGVLGELRHDPSLKHQQASSLKPQASNLKDRTVRKGDRTDGEVQEDVDVAPSHSSYPRQREKGAGCPDVTSNRLSEEASVLAKHQVRSVQTSPRSLLYSVAP